MRKAGNKLKRDVGTSIRSPTGCGPQLACNSYTNRPPNHPLRPGPLRYTICGKVACGRNILGIGKEGERPFAGLRIGLLVRAAQPDAVAVESALARHVAEHIGSGPVHIAAAVAALAPVALR